MTGYPCTIITRADVAETRRQLSIASPLLDQSWKDDGLPKEPRRWNGWLAQVIAENRTGFASMTTLTTRYTAAHRGDLIAPSGTSWEIKFVRANRYRLSRPIRTRSRADCFLLMVPACDYLDYKILQEQDELCFAGWISVKQFYACAQRYLSRGVPYLGVEQPLRPVTDHPDITGLMGLTRGLWCHNFRGYGGCGPYRIVCTMDTVNASEGIRDTMNAPRTEEVYDWADAIETAMETRPMGRAWTPSTAARVAHLTTDQAREALIWMRENVFVAADGNGAWTHYYRRH